MSAETLRRASSRIQHDVEFGQAHGDDAFLLAVADWLEKAANRIDAAFAPDTFVKYDGATRDALAVARAYLGESA